MARVILTSLADADAAYVITDLGAKAGANAADRYDTDFDKLYERLARYPESGAPRFILGPHVRICVVSPYVVIYEYRETTDIVTIMRIVHGRRKITRRLLRR